MVNLIPQTLSLASQGPEAFSTELSLLSRLQHPHLVRLLGYCAQGSTRALVYELLPGGNLAYRLRCA